MLPRPGRTSTSKRASGLPDMQGRFGEIAHCPSKRMFWQRNASESTKQSAQLSRIQNLSLGSTHSDISGFVCAGLLVGA